MRCQVGKKGGPDRPARGEASAVSAVARFGFHFGVIGHYGQTGASRLIFVVVAP